MNAKTTIALLLIAGALGAWLYVTETTDTGGSGGAVDTAQGDRLFAEGMIESKSAASLTIAPSDGPAARFVRADGKWKQVEPIAFNANAFAIERIIDAAGDLRSSATFTPSDKDYPLSEFGLDPPRAVITIEPVGGEPITLALGKTSAGGRAYAIANYVAAKASADTPVAVVDERVHDQLGEAPVTGLRDRKLPIIDANAAASIELVRGDTAVELNKIEGEWKLGKAKHRAATGAVSTLAGAFAVATVNEFTADTPTDPATYGLDKPTATITVTAAASPVADEEKPAASHTLRIGSASDLTQAHYFASLDDSPAVFTVPKAAVDRLNVAVDDLRDPKLTPIPLANLAELTVTHGQSVVKFAKHEGLWKFTEPGPGFALDGQTASDAIASLFDAKAQSYMDVTLRRLRRPLATLELVAIGKTTKKLVIYPHDDGKWMTLFAGETVGRIVDPEPFKTLLSPAWAFRDRTIFDATINDIAKVTIDRAGAHPAIYTIARKPPEAEGPSLTDPPAEGAEAWLLEGLDAQKVGPALGSLAPLRADAWQEKPIAKDAENIATVTIELVDGKKKTVRIDLDAGVGMIDGIAQAFALREGTAGVFNAELRDTRILTLDINAIASIQTHGVTIKRSAEGAFTLDGEGKLDEAKAAALFNTVAALRAERFTDVRKDAKPDIALTVTMRDGTKHVVTGVGTLVWTGEKWFTVSQETAKTLAEDPRVISN